MEQTKRILILGAGFGGLTAANILRENLSNVHKIIVIDKNKSFMMGLVNLWILYGTRKLQDSFIPLANLANKGIEFINDEIIEIDFAKNSISTRFRGKFDYDYLIISLGSELAPEKIDGFIEHGGFNLYAPLHKIKRVVSNNLIEFENGNNAKFDLLIGIPPHKVPAVIRECEITKVGDWIRVDKFTLKTTYDNVFAIGDVTEIALGGMVTIPKAGIFAEAQAKVVAQEIIDQITNTKTNAKFDGKGFCFMEVGSNEAGYIEVDLYSEDPYTQLHPPSRESYRKKLDFEETRVKNWLL